MQIHLEYFASLREAASKETEVRDTAASTLRDLYREVRAEYAFSFDEANLRVAVNDEFVSWEQALRSGDRVVFLPPMSGG